MDLIEIHDENKSVPPLFCYFIVGDVKYCLNIHMMWYNVYKIKKYGEPNELYK